MLTGDDQITFITELTDLVERFLEEYQARNGSLRNDLERGLVISFALGVMRCDLDAVWDGLSQSSVFGKLHPRVVFEECAGGGPTTSAERQELVVQALRGRAWLAAEET